MARVDRNMLVRFYRGAIGKSIVLRVRKGKTFASKFPDMSKVVRSPDQKAYNNLFGEAVVYAKSVLQDPKAKADLLARMQASKKLKDRNPLNLLVSEFLKEQSAAFTQKAAIQQVARYREKYPLSDRQATALAYIIRFGELNNSLFQQINRVSKPTATRDLADLVSKGVLRCSGKGPATSYTLLDTLQPPAGNTAESDQIA